MGLARQTPLRWDDTKLATASAAAGREEMPMEDAPKKRARKSGVG
jgi:hypothetical protein